MPMDGFTLSFLQKELRDTLLGGRVDKVNQPERDALLLLVRSGVNHRLLLSANANQARAQLTAQSYENPAEPPMFCMLMRKHLLGSRIVDTNETFGRRFRPEEFGGQVRAFVSLVKKQMPETAILLTTPPECYKRTYVNKKRTYVRNANTQLAAKAIVKAAHEEGVACWDLFATTGGKSSCIKWHKEKLMGRDRIHFTKEGYREQGTLLYRALMQSYNQMLKIRKDDE